MVGMARGFQRASKGRPGSLGQWARRGLLQLTLIVTSLIFLLPLLWMVSSSLKGNGEIFVFPPELLPAHPQWSNYAQAMSYIPFGTYFLNSALVSAATVAGTLVSCVPAAYAFSILRWPGRDLAFRLVLATIMLPFPVVMVPQYLIFRNLGWLGTLLPLMVPPFVGAFITPYFASSLAIFLLRQFMLVLPRDLIDAARIDGAGDWRLLWHVVVPLSKGSIVTVILFSFLTSWTAFVAPLIFLTKGDLFTLSLGLQQYQSLHFTAFNYLMAASFVFCLPVLVAFVLAQRYFVQGISLTGTKG